MSTPTIAETRTIFALNDAYLTIQGEGVLSGTPMYLVRLHGCDVGCPFCDTKETWGALGGKFQADAEVATLAECLGTNPHWARVTADEILSHLGRTRRGVHWILLTGGEPAAQPIEVLAEAAAALGWNVALETSGTYPLVTRKCLTHVCVSPKVGMPGGRLIVPETIAMADELKFVIGKADDIAAVHDFLGRYAPVRRPRVSVQPMSLSAKATQLCIDAALTYGWHVSIQTHKIMGVR